jgi:hypothetical protein
MSPKKRVSSALSSEEEDGHNSKVETLSDLWEHDLREEEVFPRERMAKVLANAMLIVTWLFLAKK